MAYKPTKHHVEFTGFNVIEFVVGGEGGIRLSDASEGNWAGFEGRDDRSLFEGDRLQIIIRINVRPPVRVHRRRFLTLTLSSSLLGARPGNQR